MMDTNSKRWKTYNLSMTLHYTDGRVGVDSVNKKGISRTRINSEVKDALQKEPSVMMITVREER